MKALKLIQKILLVGALFTFPACDITYYEVEHPEPTIQDRDYALGYWEADEYCEHDEYAYNLYIGKGDYYNEIYFGGDGLYESGFDIHADVDGDYIHIPVQQFRLDNNPHVFYEFSGSGTIDGDIIYLEYEVLIIDHGYITFEDYCDTHLYYDGDDY
ncbi:MAG: hypothetical protein ACI81S_001589 [Sphingobacteriales bacterium]|jgi:hypothetical protein